MAASEHDAEREITLLTRLARTGTSGSAEAMVRAAGEALLVALPSFRAVIYTVDDSHQVIARPAAAGGVSPGAPLDREPAQALLERLHGVREPLLAACTAGGEVLGGIELMPSVADLPNAREQRWLTLIADHLAAALRQARLVERLEAQTGAATVAAGAAHELNNLISAIVGRTQLLRRAVNDPPAVRSIEVIEQAALDGSSLVRRLRGRGPAQAPQPLLLAPLISEVLERARTRLEETRVAVAMMIGDAPAVDGDAGQIRQVLTNLVYNATDAMPGGGQLEVGLGASDDGQAAWIEVADSGVGMGPEIQRRMFDSYFTTKGAAGTGLGLSVSRDILQRHGGRFEVTSGLGRGTRIRLWLPASEMPATRLGPSTATAPAHSSESARVPYVGARRILLIDDDTAVREVLAEMLRTADYEVVEAATGTAGLGFLRASPFDLVFTDLGMPDMNGWEVAARARAVRPDTRVGIITGWDVRIDDTRRRALGVALVIVKPFRLQQVLDGVRGALDG